MLPQPVFAETAKVQPAAPQLSVKDLFTIGIGPSSSHTVGPMRAAASFAVLALLHGVPSHLCCELFGSLALTGKGHGTDTAVMLGLSGWLPEDIDPERVPQIVENIRKADTLLLRGAKPVEFHEHDIVFRMGEFLPGHPNAMRFTANYRDGREITQTFYSIGGGAIVTEGQDVERPNVSVRYPISSATDLLAVGHRTGLSIAAIGWINEEAWRPRSETIAFIDRVRDAMLACIEQGLQQEGTLPGGLNVRRRAKGLHERLLARGPRTDPSTVFEWVSLYALSVNEENAAGGRVVTAPTNGAAGILPAVLKYYEVFTSNPTRKGSQTFLMTAAAIGFLYKSRASISAAEMGCQGEVGVACSMAAAGLAAALGGTNEQIENAAEIGMEHNLGLTCDPVGGLVQVPCIERNTMGAIKAINAAYLALQGDGRHVVSLDAVIETMRQTGNDMRAKYKETSLGGLAVNVVEC
ncbi:MAG TPA: L-serine ammonia-lyase [Rhizomicrobium sp.]|jgi:L-serine dehydratase|nr:L-serine ammonia-lyase [Rhizomicrobium sp.]